MASELRCGAWQAGQDFSKLKSLLADGDFQAADDETRDLLIQLAGPDAVKRKWVYFTEVRPVPFWERSLLRKGAFCQGCSVRTAPCKWEPAMQGVDHWCCRVALVLTL